jgi:hypothetical protein
MVVHIETQKVPSLSNSGNCYYTQIIPMVKIISIIFVDLSHTFEAYILEFDSFFTFFHSFMGDMLY